MIKEVKKMYIATNTTNGLSWDTSVEGTWTIMPKLKNLEEDKSMENLYQVYIIEKDRTVHTLNPVVAKDEENAKLKSGVYTHHTVNPYDGLDNVTVIVQRLGTVAVEDKKEKE